MSAFISKDKLSSNKKTFKNLAELRYVTSVKSRLSSYTKYVLYFL